MPKIEDGNNFGVQVCEDVLSELTRSEEAAFNIIDQSTKYFVSRGKLLTKVLISLGYSVYSVSDILFQVMKYPNLDDYAKSIQLLDEKQYLDTRLAFKVLVPFILSCLSAQVNYVGFAEQLCDFGRSRAEES
jgi:hypothetical protein